MEFYWKMKTWQYVYESNSKTQILAACCIPGKEMRKKKLLQDVSALRNIPETRKSFRPYLTQIASSSTSYDVRHR